MTDPAEPENPVEVPEAPQAGRGDADKRHFRRIRALFAPLCRVLNKVPHPPLRSRRGLFLLFLLLLPISV